MPYDKVEMAKGDETLPKINNIINNFFSKTYHSPEKDSKNNFIEKIKEIQIL
jgi:hypothetical protein